MKLISKILWEVYGVGPRSAPRATVSWAKARIELQYGWRTADAEVTALNKWRAKKGYPLAYV